VGWDRRLRLGVVEEGMEERGGVCFVYLYEGAGVLAFSANGMGAWRCRWGFRADLGGGREARRWEVRG
jgi:hypothetical protein